MSRFLFLGLLSLALGFAAARLIPTDAGVLSAKPQAPPVVSSQIPLPATTRTLDLEAEGWQAAAEAWAVEDPAGFRGWLVQRGIPPGEEVLNLLFSAWLKQDVDAAFTAVFDLPGDFKRQEILDDMLNLTLAQPGGLDSIWKWMPAAEKQITMWSSPGQEWMRSMPPAELAALLRKHCAGFRYSGTLTTDFAEFWAGQDREAAAAWIRTLPPDLHNQAFNGMMDVWAKQDPQAALEYLRAAGTSGERFFAYAPLGELAKTDPKAALEWWETNLGVTNYNSLRKIFGSWTADRPDAALAYTLSVEDPVLHTACLEAWTGDGNVRGKAILEAALGLPPGQDRESMLLALANRGGGSGDQESVATLRKMAEAGPESGITAQTAAVTARSFAREDPGAALAWVGTLPEEFQAESTRFVLSQWGDKVAAAQAVEALPDGPFREKAREALQPVSKDPFR